MGPPETESFCKAKDMVNKTKRQPTEWEKIFTNTTSDRGLISKIYKELKKLVMKGTYNPVKQMGYRHKPRTLNHCWWECKLVQPLWKSVWRFLRKLGNNVPQDPAIPLLGIYPKDAQSCYKDMCSSMFIAALFVIARTCKQPKCSSIEEWIRKIWYIYTMEYTQQKKMAA